MKKSLSLIFALIMLISAIPFSAYAGVDYQDLIYQGLADPATTKTTENYDGYNLVAGSKCTWDCKLYNLTASVSKVEGKKITISFNFTSKIPKAYIEDADGWDGYEICVGPYTFFPGEKKQFSFVWDTSEPEEGMNFLKIRINNHARNAFTINSSNSYYEAIKKNRRCYPENSSYINEVYVEDICALSFYNKPEIYLYPSKFTVKQKSISLGTYTFETIVKWKAKNAKTWKEKTFAANKNVLFKNLKPGSQYHFQVLFSLPYTDPETGKKMKVIDLLQDAFYINTAQSKSPVVTSVKISNCKFGKETINGYWESDGDWHPSETFNTAKYTIKVSVKKLPKNIKGLRLKVGSATYYAKGRKKTYTFKVKYRDRKKIKGKKITSYFAYSGNTFTNSPLGLSPAKKFSYKIKNGTYR